MMDSDRWETAMALQRNASTTSSSSKEEKDGATSNNSKEKKPNNRDNTISSSSRYGSDMEQAYAMKRAAAVAASKKDDYNRSSLAGSSSRSRKVAVASSRSSSSRRLLTANDIQLGMTGLEKAGDLARKGELAEAMKIYELSLELLIRYLQSPDSVVNDDSITGDDDDDDDATANGKNIPYDRSFVETLVKIALSDAESVKATLKARAAANKTNNTAQQPSAESTREKDGNNNNSSYFSGLVDLLSSACKVTSPISSGKSTDAAKSTSITQKPSAPCAAAATTTTGPSVRTRSKTQQIPSRPAATTTTVTRRSAPSSLAATRGEASSSISARRLPAAPAAAAATTTTTTTVALESSAASNELRQIILNDFLVPPHSLQKTTWSDIAGLENVKQSLQETAILPLVRPDLFTGLRRPQNILLYGPPGTGKTMLVRAVAHESGSHLFCCSASSLTSKWMGEAEKLVKTLFQVAAQASPSLIFIDEVDALLSSRKSDGEHEASRRLKTEFMIQMEGISSTSQGDSNSSHVLVLACTNCPWDVDSAVLRRFPRRIHVPLPDAPARTGMLQHLLQKAGKHSVTTRQMSSLVNRLEGFSCSDISAIASEAAFGPIRDLGDMQSVRAIHASKVRPISMQDFETAMTNATKTVTEAQLRRYQEWQQEQGASSS